MFQLGILGGALLVVGVCTWLSKEENHARENYYRSSDRLYTETKQREAELKRAMRNQAQSQEFSKNIVLYTASVKSADACYQSYHQQKQLLNICHQRKQEFGSLIGKLKKQRDDLKVRKANGEKGIGKLLAEVHVQLAEVRGYFAEVKIEIANLKQVKEALLMQVRELNDNTRKLKLHIRDHCGRGGRIWYERKVADL